ncbi:MAG: HRDC domain-containing protein [Desulfuromonadales bacterium]
MPHTPILIDRQSIKELAAELARETSIAVDLEADSMHSYREKVCLLQFSTPQRTVLVDPLAVDDLSDLNPVLADASIRKIFHAADYDMRCMYRDFGFEVRGLFDTMIACQFLGEEKVGLADVLNKYYEVELDKKYQRADWSVRPLEPEMIRYAAEDTRHLHRLAALLEEKLFEKGRRDWVAEEFSLLEQVRFSESEGPMFARIKGAGKLDPRQLAILEALLQWRDEEARRRDRPPFKVVGNRQLLEVARHAPQSLRALVGLEGVFPRMVDRYGRHMLKQVEEALSIPSEELPVFPRTEVRRRSDEAKNRLAKLKEWRRIKARELELEPGVLINNALLENLADHPPATDEGLSEVAGMKDWQRRVLGDDIVRILAG